MLKEVSRKQILKKKRALRVRKHLRGSSQKPRMCVVKTNKHIEVQLIDDEAGHTLGSISTYSKQFKNTEFNRRNKATANKIGQAIAQIAKEINITEVVFDRGPAKYHGVLAELANAARECGLKF